MLSNKVIKQKSRHFLQKGNQTNDNKSAKHYFFTSVKLDFLERDFSNKMINVYLIGNLPRALQTLFISFCRNMFKKSLV